MKDTSKMDPAMLLLMGMTMGGSESIEFIERQGQAELVDSEMLPREMGDRSAYEALGIRFDDDSGDPLFIRAFLPDGWRKVASDHDMWSYVVDGAGTRRISVFYKAAPYDRSAFMRLERVDDGD